METRVFIFTQETHNVHSFPSSSRPLAPLITYPAPESLSRSLCGGPVALVLGSGGLFDLRDGLFCSCCLFLFSVGLDPHVVQAWLVYANDLLLRDIIFVSLDGCVNRGRKRKRRDVEKRVLRKSLKTTTTTKAKKNFAYSSPPLPCALRPARASR